MKKSNIIAVGLQWGDEGKGKVIDYLSSRAEYVVRSQGGNNAGHTVIAEGKEYKFHLIPSGILYPHVQCLIGGGTVIDPESLLQEIRELRALGISLEGRLFISMHAHLVFPYHRLMDKIYEERRGGKAIGTTGRGIGPCYADKTQRIGIRFAECQDRTLLKERLEQVACVRLAEGIVLDVDSLVNQYVEYAKELSCFTRDMEGLLHRALKNKKKILFEGAHGTSLDLTFGTYPYVTSSSTIAAGICMGVGIGPTCIDHVLGIVKAYTTRVGAGPLPTALSAEEEKAFVPQVVAREVGTTTGRLRRLGWLDIEQIRMSIALNGVGSLALTKLDILDSLDSIKLCTGYNDHSPIYEVFPGWKTSTSTVERMEDLPQAAKKYIARIEELCDVAVSMVSVGPERDKTLVAMDIF